MSDEIWRTETPYELGSTETVDMSWTVGDLKETAEEIIEGVDQSEFAMRQFAEAVLLALEAVKREARNKAIEATLAALQRHCNDEWVKNLRVPHVKRMIALMEDQSDE